MPCENFGGKVIPMEVFHACIAEIRSACNFPIRPDELQPLGESAFGESLKKFVAPDTNDLSQLEITMVYMKCSKAVMTLAQVSTYMYNHVQHIGDKY